MWIETSSHSRSPQRRQRERGDPRGGKFGFEEREDGGLGGEEGLGFYIQ